MGLRAVLRSGVAAVCIAGTVAPTGYAAPSSAPRPAVDVRVAQAKDFSRIEFHWAGGARFTQRRDGQRLILRFSRDAKPDLSQIRVSPPKWLKTAEASHVGGKLEVALVLADGAEAKAGQADGAIFVNLFKKPPAPVETAAAALPLEPPPAAPPPRLDPLPASGVVRMQVEVAAAQVKLRFDWKNPLGAAVFRRGEAVWIVFDAPASLDVKAAPRGVSQFSRVEAFEGLDYAAVRIVSPRDTPVSVVGQGASWTVAFGPGPKTEKGDVSVERDDEAASAQLTAALSGARDAIWLDDPAVGDRIAVVPALAPAKGLSSRREYVEMALLPTMHGLAVEPYAADLQVRAEGDLVRIGRPKGLALSPSSAARKRADAAAGAPQPASMPGLIGADWARTGSGGFIARYDALVSAAADEMGKGSAAPVAARMALARFLVGCELSYEAIGVLNNAAKSRQTLLSDPEFRALRGVAKVMSGRLKEAETDFATPILGDDPATQLWRGYIAVQAGNYAEARQKFAAGLLAENQFSPVWKARFARADAEAALALGDVPAAGNRIAEALNEKLPAGESLANRLIQARVMEALGQNDRALRVYQAIAKAPLEQVASPALLRATQIRLDTGQLTPAQASTIFDGLRFRWRGDATELETIRLLGQLYLNQGRYREALETLRSAGFRLPDLPQAVQLQNDLAAAFRGLFLDGLADGLEPIQAVALFYDFKDLTPIGADGDLMVRKLVRRLVDVDLLAPAAELLKYQVENRLDGVPKAQVATDLAVIYLMDRKPESALQTINASRTTILPTALNTERRIVTARALMGLGRLDAAEEIIEPDRSPEAQDVRAEIAWKQHNWPLAATMFEASLGERWKQDLPLKVEEEGKLLRAGVAYSLAGDDEALTRLRGRYDGLFDRARNPEALRVAFAGVDGGTLTANDFSRAVADNEGFAGWVAKMKQRFREKPAPVTTRTAEAATAAAG